MTTSASLPITRRRFVALLAAACASRGLAKPPATAGRRLDFAIGEGFGGASLENIEAVLRSAADSIWRHCPDTRWETPGFFIFRGKDSPITLDEHRADGRIAIGLNTGDTYWAQYAYQFSHEFCHALAGHSNDWRKLFIRGRRPNHWLEESLCETASLFALRAMGAAWKSDPPYPNWRDFSSALTSYAQDRLDQVAKEMPEGRSFVDWFRENEPSMRENATLRDKNNLVALQLLPLFEARPSGWEAIAFINRMKSDVDRTLAEHFAAWKDEAPIEQRPFITSVAGVFLIGNRFSGGSDTRSSGPA
jgi:hypothetical protein